MNPWMYESNVDFVSLLDLPLKFDFDNSTQIDNQFTIGLKILAIIR